MSQGAPDVDQETPNAVERAKLDELGAALRARHGEDVVVDVDARTGAHAAIIFVLVRLGAQSIEVFAFVRTRSGNGVSAASDDGGSAKDQERALSSAIDFVDGVIPELKRGRNVPLDWELRTFAGAPVLVRGERRDYEAEREAARLLGEPTRPTGIAGLAHRFD